MTLIKSRRLKDTLFGMLFVSAHATFSRIYVRFPLRIHCACSGRTFAFEIWREVSDMASFCDGRAGHARWRQETFPERNAQPVSRFASVRSELRLLLFCLFCGVTTTKS
eukprot:3935426-Rhodomonas_salina.1